ncbi:MAG: hypothetical protein BWY99_01786 [Synergistetes bacterium ADurb.BinA166]|nr:MAG: hypothetical protein BWY99_01786 [Synergistetes bacterium ADurb.BinA166]
MREAVYALSYPLYFQPVLAGRAGERTMRGSAGSRRTDRALYRWCGNPERPFPPAWLRENSGELSLAIWVGGSSIHE